MNKVYIVKGDHWAENFTCYAPFYESESSKLAILCSCLAASEGSGAVSRTDLIQWCQEDLDTIRICYGYAGDCSMTLTKEENLICIMNKDLSIFGEKEYKISRDKFSKLADAWKQILQKRPVIIEFSEEDGVYRLLPSKGQEMVVE